MNIKSLAVLALLGYVSTSSVQSAAEISSDIDS